MKKEIKNATIKNVNIGFDEKRDLTAWVMIDFGGNAVQGFGGLNLSVDGNCLNFFKNIFLVVGNVAQTNQLIGKAVRVYHDHSKIYAIGNFVDDDVWYSLDKESIVSSDSFIPKIPNKITKDSKGKNHHKMSSEAGKVGSSLKKNKGKK